MREFDEPREPEERSEPNESDWPVSREVMDGARCCRIDELEPALEVRPGRAPAELESEE